MNILRAFIFCVVLSCSANGLAEQINACDAAAGHPSDPNKVGPGVVTEQMVTHVAIPACRAALQIDADNPRWQYQLGRALYYWADANDGDKQEALQMLQKSADQNYPQAMFVTGLLRKYSGRACDGRELVRDAADQGLKSARLTYVSDSLAQVYADCGARLLSDEALLDYVSAAKTQTAGYYENMLVSNLERELKARIDGQNRRLESTASQL